MRTPPLSVKVVFTLAAIDDLRHIGPSAVPKVLKKILLLEQDAHAGFPLGGALPGFRKLVVGRNTWRIVYRVNGDCVEVCEVWAVGLRSDAEVYTEAASRVASQATADFATLADVVERLSTLTGARQLEEARTPVPDWLADRLVHNAGIPAAEVAAMDAVQGLDVWTEFCSRPKD
jgi:mRNA interferase RelE/StbE